MNALWLAHHPPGQYERCFRVGRFHVCRRCAVLYGVAAITAALSLAGLHWPARWDATLLYLLPLPVTIEFIAERAGGLRYHAGRQMLATLIAAPALGRGFARYFARPSDPLFWRMVLLFGGVCLLALLLTRRRR
jgi:hypothetical protein